MNTFYDFSIERKDDEALIETNIEYNERKLLKGEQMPAEPMEMVISEGSKLYDIVGFQDTSNFAISERLFSLLRDNNITGWNTYRISITGNEEIYYGFQVIGKCGKLEESAVPGFSIGYKFDFTLWDGSDFFSPENTSLIFCTSKVRDLIKKNKITNVELTDISKVRNYSVGDI